jgi:hypothetical protein
MLAPILEKDQPAAQAKEQKVRPQKRASVRGFVNSPYLFVLVPLLLGGYYLITHPQYIAFGINHPYAVAFLLALPVCVFAVKLVVNFFSVIEQWIRLQFEKARQSKKGYFFEVVTAVFMFVSICEAGPFFNDIQHNVLGGALGYLTVFAFDLIAVVCIDARRKEKARGGTMAGIYLAGVIICAAVSIVANLYSALLNFQAPSDPTFPAFLKAAAPYIGIMFPVMIIFLAFSRDTEIEIDDAETYRIQQQKRVDFLVVRREILEQVTSEMERIDQLNKRAFFLKSIFFTRKKMAYVIEVVTARARDFTNTEIAALRQELSRKEHTINEQIQLIQGLSDEVQQLSAMLAGQGEIVAAQQAEIVQLRQEVNRVQYDFSNAIERYVEQHMAAKIQSMHQDSQHDVELPANTDTNDLEQTAHVEDTPVIIEEQPSQQEQEVSAKTRVARTGTRANYGLTDEEKQTILNAFPALEQWFSKQPFSVTLTEIVEMTALRPIRITNAIAGKKIKSARGRNNKVQTESCFGWLLQDLQRAARRPKHTARPIKVDNFLEDFLTDNTPEENTSEIAPNAETNEPRTEELEITYLPENAISISIGDKNKQF